MKSETITLHVQVRMEWDDTRVRRGDCIGEAERGLTDALHHVAPTYRLEGGTASYPSWDGDAMVCRVIRKDDLIEFLLSSRSLLRDYEPRGGTGLAGVCDGLAASSSVADATQFLRALGHKDDD